MSDYENTGKSRRNRFKGENGFDMDAWWEDRSLVQKILWGILFGIGGIAFTALFGWAVMLLWNWLMPEIFGLPLINYWKAWGLLALSFILFKGIRIPHEESSRRTEKKRKRELRRYMQDEATEEPES